MVANVGALMRRHLKTTVHPSATVEDEGNEFEM
jgi:hypothetical protein